MVARTRRTVVAPRACAPSHTAGGCMSTGNRLRMIRAILATGVALRALGWGIAAALTVIVGAALMDLLVPLSLGVRTALLVIAVLSVIAVASALAWRDRTV